MTENPNKIDEIVKSIKDIHKLFFSESSAKKTSLYDRLKADVLTQPLRKGKPRGI